MVEISNLTDDIPIFIKGMLYAKGRTIRIGRRVVDVPDVYARWGGWDVLRDEWPERVRAKDAEC